MSRNTCTVSWRV
nr:TPA_asm: m69.4 sORF 2 [Murid betaherpesvirus 1]DBA07811.1 TPA_asm: m69.4 sORF 2 [Murid betaherpesvirus 1]